VVNKVVDVVDVKVTCSKCGAYLGVFRIAQVDLSILGSKLALAEGPGTGERKGEEKEKGIRNNRNTEEESGWTCV